MSTLIKELKLCSTLTRTIHVLHPPDTFPDLSPEDWDLKTAQGFIWYSNFVGFDTRGNVGDYWVKIYTSKSLELQADIARAIVVPFDVPESGDLLVSDSDDVGVPFKLPPGRYKLLFETRYLTDSEIESCGDHYDYLLEYVKDPDIEFDDERRPELCCFTFIPTQDTVEPEILIPTYESLEERRQQSGILFDNDSRTNVYKPPRKLVLHHRPRPEEED